MNGNTGEVSGFKHFLAESGIHDAILIADKGFYSKANIGLLENHKLQYILPLKRNDGLIGYSKLDEAQNDCFHMKTGPYGWRNMLLMGPM